MKASGAGMGVQAIGSDATVIQLTIVLILIFAGEGLPNRKMASIPKVVRVCPKWSLFRKVVWLRDNLGQWD